MRLFLTLFALALPALVGQGNTRPIVLTWQASTSPGVTGYNVFKSATTGGPYAKINLSIINGLTFTDPAETIGSSVFYVATAVGAVCTSPPSGPCGESPFSTEVSVINVPARPNPTGQIIIVIP